MEYPLTHQTKENDPKEYHDEPLIDLTNQKSETEATHASCI